MNHSIVLNHETLFKDVCLRVARVAKYTYASEMIDKFAEVPLSLGTYCNTPALRLAHLIVRHLGAATAPAPARPCANNTKETLLGIWRNRSRRHLKREPTVKIVADFKK